MAEKKEIKERQFFYQNGFYLLLCTVLISLIIYHFIKTNREISDVIGHIIPILILLSISLLSLKVSIAKSHISFQWIWFVLFFKENIIPTDSTEEIKVVKYNFFEGGLGYGIRYSKKYGNVYNIHGNVGLSLKTTKRKLLIGIQKESAIKEFILKNFPSKNE